MPIVGETVNLYFRFLDSTGAPLDITAPEDIPTLYLKLNDTVVLNDDDDLEPAGFEDWWLYAWEATASGEVFARAKTTDSDAAGDGTTLPVTFEVSRFGFTGTEGAYKVNSALDATERTSIAAAVWNALTSGLTTVGSIGKFIVDKLSPVNAGSITYTNPVNPVTQLLELIRGDDYTEETGRQLPTWQSTDWTPYSLLTAQSITFRAKTKYGSTVFEKAAEALSATQVRVELTSTDTKTFGTGRDGMNYDVEAELAGGEIVTLAQGKTNIIEDVR